MNISRPVLLEQLAEEACELGQAALKLARKIRRERVQHQRLKRN